MDTRTCGSTHAVSTKTSSAELQEAINSMYTWYMDAQVCYAYLADVPSIENAASGSPFKNSRYFTRGWTLQEMIAPPTVRFFAEDWVEIGERKKLVQVLNEITSVDVSVLRSPQPALEEISVAQKMSWAAGRQTTRIEDRAYSLMGLFGVNIPVIYGEGARAFNRLQREIIQVTADHTIFAWEETEDFSGMFAGSPDAFAKSSPFRAMPHNKFLKDFGIGQSTLDYALTNFGLHIQLPLGELHSPVGMYMAYLACTYGEEQLYTVIYLRQQPGKPDGHFFRTRHGSRCWNGKKTIGMAQPGHGEAYEKLWITKPERKWIDALRPFPAAPAFGGTGAASYRLSLHCDDAYLQLRDVYPYPPCLKPKSLDIDVNDGYFCVASLWGSTVRAWIKIVFGVINKRPFAELMDAWMAGAPGEQRPRYSVRSLYQDYNPFAFGPRVTDIEWGHSTCRLQVVIRESKLDDLVRFTYFLREASVKRLVG